jgi:hypothetical protein
MSLIHQIKRHKITKEEKNEKVDYEWKNENENENESENDSVNLNCTERRLFTFANGFSMGIFNSRILQIRS